MDLNHFKKFFKNFSLTYYFINCCMSLIWSGWVDSNHQPADYWRRIQVLPLLKLLNIRQVGCADQLSHTRIYWLVFIIGISQVTTALPNYYLCTDGQLIHPMFYIQEYTLNHLVLPLGFEPRSCANLAPYAGYKPVALPLCYGSIK